MDTDKDTDGTNVHANMYTDMDMYMYTNMYTDMDMNSEHGHGSGIYDIPTYD